MIFKNILLSISMFLALSLTSLAQDPPYPNWLWAKSGGSTSELQGVSAIHDHGWERIVDLAIDSDNNYYFLAEVGGLSFTYDGMEFDTYNNWNAPQSRDIFLFSTDNNGNYRWSKTIGGGLTEFVISIVVDENKNVYVTGALINSYNNSTPAHFDEDYVFDTGTNTPGPNNKKAFLIKYDSEGELQWFRQPEGDEVLYNATSSFVRTIIDSEGRIHSLMWFAEGTHLDGQLTVPEGNFQAVIVIYNSDGDLETFIPLDMSPHIVMIYNYQMAYDANLDRYYIADTYRIASDPDNPLSINGYGADTPYKAFYLAAVNGQGEVIWYHENHQVGGWNIGQDLELDASGNVYLTGWTADTDSFAGYAFDMETTQEKKSPFLLKFDSDGNLLWGTHAEGYSPFPGQSIVVAGNDVYLGLGMLGTTWNGIQIPHTPGQGLAPDIAIMRFDASTGIAQEVIHVQDTPSRDVIMAMEMDSEGALVVGGYFNGTYLFHGAEFQLQKEGFGADFFIAKYQTPHNPGVGINEAATLKSVIIYPNPTSGLLHLQSIEPLRAYTLYDLRGKTVSTGSLNTHQVNLTGVDAGVYILETTTWDDKVEWYKVVRE